MAGSAAERMGWVKTYGEVAESLGCHQRTVANAMKALNEQEREPIVPWWRVVYGGRPGKTPVDLGWDRPLPGPMCP